MGDQFSQELFPGTGFYRKSITHRSKGACTRANLPEKEDSMEDHWEANNQQLDILFKASCHGAVNIRSIRYQV